MPHVDDTTRTVTSSTIITRHSLCGDASWTLPSMSSTNRRRVAARKLSRSFGSAIFSVVFLFVPSVLDVAVVSAVPRVPRVRAGACARGWADSSLGSTRARVRGIPGARRAERVRELWRYRSSSSATRVVDLEDVGQDLAHAISLSKLRSAPGRPSAGGSRAPAPRPP